MSAILIHCGRTRAAVLAALVVVAPMIVIGCARPSVSHAASTWPIRDFQTGTSRQSNGIHAYIGVDATGSYRDCLGGAVLACARLTESLDPDTDHLTVLRVDRETTELYDNPPIDDEERQQQILVAELQKMPPQTGTFPAPFFQDVAQRAQADAGPVGICLYSDGDNDDADPRAIMALRRAAEDLARNRNVRFVAIVGVRRENRAWLHAVFAPLGTRFSVFGPLEADLDSLVQTLHDAQPERP